MNWSLQEKAKEDQTIDCYLTKDLIKDKNNILCPILIYESFTNDKAIAKGANVYIDKFRDDLNTLLDNGYISLSLSDVLKHKSEKTPLPDKSFCVVLSGGYEGQYKYAFPVLKELRVHADAFVATDLVGASSYPGLSQFTPHFGWDAANQMDKSGVVSIYALWHPFDNGKSYETEMQNKINLIRDMIPGSNPDTAFFINMAKDTDAKQNALEKAGVKLNLVYYWSYNNDLNNKGHLPYIGVNQESNILDVIDAFNSKTKCQLGLNTGLDSIEQLDFSWMPKSCGITLPIDCNPRIKNLLRNAIPLSVIGGVRRDKADQIVLNNFIDVVFRPWYHFFDYDNHLYLNWPELSCCRLDKDMIQTSNINAADFILDGLHNGFCADLWTDQYYIPAKPGYMCQHLSHNVMIYGYTNENDTFKAISYTNSGHFEPFDLKPDDLLRSCHSEYFNSIQLIKNNPDCQVTYDTSIIKQKLERYITSGYEYANNSKNTQYDPHQYVNYAACVKFPEYFRETHKKENRLYPVCIFGFAEHKRCMGWRLHYIADHEYSSNVAERIINLSTKYMFRKNDGIINTIAHLMEEINLEEHTAITKLLEHLS